jgi:hypothetical protein
MVGGGHGRGGAARSRGGNSPETSRPATTRHQRLGGWPRRAKGDLADSAEGTTPARENQRALHTAKRGATPASNCVLTSVVHREIGA